MSSLREYVNAYALACSGRDIPEDRLCDVLAVLPPPLVDFDRWLVVRDALRKVFDAGNEVAAQPMDAGEINAETIAKAERGGLAIDAGILTVESVPNG